MALPICSRFFATFLTDDENGDSLFRLNVRETLNRFGEPARSRVRCVFRGEMDYRDAIA